MVCHVLTCISGKFCGHLSYFTNFLILYQFYNLCFSHYNNKKIILYNTNIGKPEGMVLHFLCFYFYFFIFIFMGFFRKILKNFLDIIL